MWDLSSCAAVLCLVAQSCRLFATLWTVTHQAPLSMRILQARGVWWATVQRVAKSQTRLEQLSMGSGKNLKDWPQELKLQRQLNLINQTREQFMLQGTVENTATSQQMVEPKT